METVSWLSIGPAALAWAAAVGVWDARFRRIPNTLTLGGWAAGIAALSLSGQGLLGASVGSCLAGACVALALSVPAYAFGKLGAGDVKLLVAMRFIGGLGVLLQTYMVAGLLAGAAAFLWIHAYRYTPWLAGFATLGAWAAAVPEPSGRRLPFGLFLATGFWSAIFLPLRFAVAG